MSRPAPGHAQPPSQWVLGLLVKRKMMWEGGIMLAIYLHLAPRLRMNGIYFYSPYMPPWHIQGQFYIYDTNTKPAVIPHAVCE